MDTVLPKTCYENQAMLLSRATECLAKAAVALSDAAEAVAEAAKSFISDTDSSGAILMPQSATTTEGDKGVASVADHGSNLDSASDSDSSSSSDGHSTPTRHTNNAYGSLDRFGEISSDRTRGTPPITDDDENRGTQSSLQINENPTGTHSPANEDILATKTVLQPPPSYRILLDDEADVFLTVCYLIRQGRKAVCYVRSSIVTLDVYQALLNTTEVPVHTFKSFSPQEIERVLKAFHSDYSSVLLLPATRSLSFRIEEPDSWVIHVGWPTNEQLYEQQVTEHQAKNNVFVAFSGDRDIYPSSSKLLVRTHPWPRDEMLFKEACTALRPLFNKNLDAIPTQTKARVYPDWITIHGVLGPYHPPTWTATTLVCRANQYLVDVLRYNTGLPSNYSGVKIVLPAVSAGFVTHQKLESAVAARVLGVKPNSGPLYIRPPSYPSAVKIGPTPLNEEVSRPGARDLVPGLGSAPITSSAGPNIPPSSNTGLDKVPTLNPSNSTSIPSRPASGMSLSSGAGGNKQSDRLGDMTTSRTMEYLIIESELDAIPSVCYLSMQPQTKNVICFVKFLSVFTPLVKILEQMIAKPVFSVNATGWLNESNKQALHSSTGCLILCNMHAELPTGLRDIPFSLTVHFGWVDNPATYHAQIQQSNNTVILLRRETQAPSGQELLSSLARAGVAPASASTKRLYNRQTPTSILEPGRLKLKALLSSSTSISCIRSSYMGWITHHCQGQHKELEWSAIDVVTHANRYFKGIFRYGVGGDVIQERPWVTRRFVEHHGLEAAETVGLLTVRG